MVAMEAMDRKSEKIVLYDGVCNLCDGAIRFILPRDTRGNLRFASLQGEFARAILTRHGIPISEIPESLILVENDRVFLYSDGALRIARNLDWPWRALAGFLLVPRPIRDGIYRWVARNRYRWFGKQETCLLPSAKWKARFLETPAEP